MNMNQAQDKNNTQLISKVRLLEKRILQLEKLNKNTARNNADFRELIFIQKEQYRQLAVLKKQNQKQIETFQDLQESENDQMYVRHTKLLNEHRTLQLVAYTALIVSIITIVSVLLPLYFTK